MAREIKFRAWDKKYMYYDLDYLQSRGSIVLGGMGDCFDLSSEIDLEHVKLMQSTGLKDKNGKEIYEGDLIKFINLMPIEAKEEIAEVKFVLEDTFLPYIYPFVNISSYNYKTKHFEGFGVNSKDCEVVGNIYENSELLNKREKNNVR